MVHAGVFLTAVSREKETQRLEGFSDGIFAFAIALLILDLYDPTTKGSSLFQGLLDEWPTFFAFATSFMTVLVMWMNHHNMFNYIKRTSRELMLLNGLLLLFVVLTPFTTSLVSEHLLHPDAIVAAMIYSGSFLVLSFVWNFLWHNAGHHHELISEHIPQVQIRRVAREYNVAPLAYATAFLLAFVSPIATVASVIAIAVFYAITVTGGEQFPKKISPAKQ